MAEKESNQEKDQLSILLTYFTYFNDSKFNHIVIFATVLFGQFQIKNLFLKNVDIHCDTFFIDIISIFPALVIYFGMTIFGIYGIFRIKYYARRTFEFDDAIRRYRPDTFSVQKIHFKELMGPVLFLKTHFLDHTIRIVLIYLLISLIILFI